ncbi:MAG: hypothetical protein A6F71_08690 [Cycloclasticus sp. symbiont of Poecilosclerida sp. M]|nr:MAG: hypothetical protein A6F71_08690 [Cycloclasticus sp. symbiont of Poecilosclerida sp. M]
MREEIENLHIFFAGWFKGELAKDSFEEGFVARFNTTFLLIPPAGTFLTLKELQTTTYMQLRDEPCFKAGYS